MSRRHRPPELGHWAPKPPATSRRTSGRFWRSVLEAVRRTLAKPGPLTLEGTIFIVLAFLIGLAAMNTGTNLLYLIFSLMMAFILVSGLLSSRTLKKLSVQRSLPKHIVAGRVSSTGAGFTGSPSWSSQQPIRSDWCVG